MLTKMREKFAGGIAIAILAIIGVSFVFFGNNLGTASAQVAAKVNGSEIGIGQLELLYREQLQANPGIVDAPAEYRASLRRQLLDELIRQRLVDLYLSDSGYRVSDEAIDEGIRNIAEFQIDGEYSEAQATQFLATRQLTVESFREQQLINLRRSQLGRAIGGTSFVTPSDYRRYLNLMFEQRLASVARFDVETLMADIEVTDGMVESFYNDNDNLFLMPESADIEYIEFNRAAIGAQIDISEDALYDHYLNEQDRYLQPEQRRARHVLISIGDDEDAARAAAADALTRIQSGEAFAAVAAEVSMDGGTAPNGGELGTVTRDQMPGELGAEIFAMQQGDLSGPIKSEFGFHVVRLDEIIEPGPLPLDEVRGELLNELRDIEAEEGFRDLQQAASNELFNTKNMAEIASAVGLTVDTLPGFQRSGGGTFGQNQAAIDAVFDPVVLGGDVSQIVELDANRSAIFKVSEYREAARQPIDAVIGEIETAIRTQQAGLDAFNRASELMAALDAGADFATTASDAGASVTGLQSFGRADNTVEPAIAAAVFGAAKPNQSQPTRGQVPTSDGGYAVYSLEAVIPGRPEAIPLEQRDAGKQQLTQQAGVSDYLAFIQSLYDEADIVINEDVVAQQDQFQ
ncbi:MAG: peptidyl-prolyl cis-trans isomerase [Pseudomonadota bacterium]